MTLWGKKSKSKKEESQKQPDVVTKKKSESGSKVKKVAGGLAEFKSANKFYLWQRSRTLSGKIGDYVKNVENPKYWHEQLMTDLDEIIAISQKKLNDGKDADLFGEINRLAVEEQKNINPKLGGLDFKYANRKDIHGHVMEFRLPVEFPSKPHICRDGSIQGLRFEYWEKITEDILVNGERQTKKKDWNNLFDIHGDVNSFEFCLRNGDVSPWNALKNSYSQALNGSKTISFGDRPALNCKKDPKDSKKFIPSSRLLEFRVVFSSGNGDRREFLCNQVLAYNENGEFYEDRMNVGPGVEGSVLVSPIDKDSLTETKAGDIKPGFTQDMVVSSDIIHTFLNEIVSSQAVELADEDKVGAKKSKKASKDKIKKQKAWEKARDEGKTVEFKNDEWKFAEAMDKVGNVYSSYHDLASQQHDYYNKDNKDLKLGYAAEVGTAAIWDYSVDKRYQKTITLHGKPSILVARIVAGNLTNLYVQNSTKQLDKDSKYADKKVRRFTEIPWEKYADYFRNVRLERYAANYKKHPKLV